MGKWRSFLQPGSLDFPYTSLSVFSYFLLLLLWVWDMTARFQGNGMRYNMFINTARTGPCSLGFSGCNSVGFQKVSSDCSVTLDVLGFSSPADPSGDDPENHEKLTSIGVRTINLSRIYFLSILAKVEITVWKRAWHCRPVNLGTAPRTSLKARRFPIRGSDLSAVRCHRLDTRLIKPLSLPITPERPDRQSKLIL
jgi:hypothetical protein